MKRDLPDSIRGAGGGGGKGGGGSARVPVESPDSLRSRQLARVVDLVSEGEIVGLVDGLRSVYLDDTPIQNADGSYNFSGIVLESRVGTQSQSYIAGFASVEAEVAVSTEILAATPVVRTITNANADAVRVTISIPQLTFQSAETGDISGTSVDIYIDLQDNGGGYVQVVADTISGKTTSRYQRSYRIELTGTGPWDIRVRRSADATTSNEQKDTYWDSYTEIIDAKLSYPNSAVVGLSVDAEYFRTIPRRGYELRGLKVLVPSNYNPTTRAYTGTWDGTFQLAWTNNPAWCFYDLLTSERYGLGAFLDASQVDKWTLYEIAQYCDELVDDGYGGQEPRFTCNLYLENREEAYRVVASMAAVFAGITYWHSGAVVAAQDAPADPVALFTPANVSGGAFTYSGSSKKARHTVALVSWNDPDDMYRQKVEYVEDEEGIARYGVIQTEVMAFGCTSRGQAHRYGRRILYTERRETETVAFRAGLDGLAVMPGSVIQTSDPVRAGARLGGRILSASDTVIDLDSSVVLAADETYTLWVVLPDGTVESRAVVTPAGTVASVEVSPAFSGTPQALAMWVLAGTDVAPESWRVIGIREVDQQGAAGATEVEITALQYTESKYEEIETGVILEALPTSGLSATQDAPEDLVSEESLYLVNAAVVGTRLTVSWTGQAQYYELQYRREGENLQTLSTSSTSVDLQPVQPGVYEFSLRGVNALGVRSQAVTSSKTVYGLRALPQAVSGLALAAIGGFAQLTFDPAPDLDVRVGGYLRVRHTPDIVAPDWSSAIDIGPQTPGNSTTATLALVPGTYLAKWVDSSGNESATASTVKTDAPNVLALNTVESLVEDPSFSGMKTAVALDGTGALILDSAETIGEQLGLISTWPLLSLLGDGIASEGTYLFTEGIDLGNVQTSRVTAALEAQGFDALDLISARGLVSLWPSVSGEVITDASCAIYIRTTNDDPAGAPTWTAWAPLVVGDYTARAFEFKAVLSSDYPYHNVRVSALSVTVDMPDRIEQGNDIASGTGVYGVVYTLPFIVAPALGLTAQDMATGDYYSVTGKSATGFSVRFFNAAGTPVSRTFDYIAKGY